LADLLSCAELCPPEQDIMFQDMHKTACIVGFVFGTDIEGKCTVDQRNRVSFIEKDPHAVIEFERLCLRLFLAKGLGRDETGNEEKDRHISEDHDP
jgi:hypothetical protein